VNFFLLLDHDEYNGDLKSAREVSRLDILPLPKSVSEANNWGSRYVVNVCRNNSLVNVFYVAESRSNSAKELAKAAEYMPCTHAPRHFIQQLLLITRHIVDTKMTSWWLSLMETKV
jgi:hypothetical protein